MIIKTAGTQKDSKVITLDAQKISDPRKTMHYTVDYDSTQPEETLRKFIADIRGMVSRYEGNRSRIAEIEQEINDLEHYMEIASYKTVPNGYRLYRKLAELRRERRACKSECDLLQPIYEYFHATEVLNRLSLVQGECAKAKGAIDARTYTIRTNVLDKFLEPDKDVSADQIIDLGKDLTGALAVDGM